MNRRTLERLAGRVWLAQAIYYLVSGVWPLVEIRSFQALTGPKVDLWLVKTVGVLVAVVGAALGAAGARGRITPEMAMVAMGTGAGLAAIDTVYVTRRRISPVYLLDAAGELLLLAGWFFALRRRGFLTR